MGMFDFFRRKERPTVQWHDVAANLSGTLWLAMHEHPEMLANIYARVVLRDDWSVALACDKREPAAILRPGEVSFAFLRENEAAYLAWINGLKSAIGPTFQQIATEQFAKSLVRALAEGVEIVD